MPKKPGKPSFGKAVLARFGIGDGYGEEEEIPVSDPSELVELDKPFGKDDKGKRRTRQDQLDELERMAENQTTDSNNR